MTEHVEAVEEQLTVEDILNDADKVEFHPILRVWQEILDSSKQVRQERITPQWALRVITSHPDMHFADMPDYRDLYYQSIDELAEALKVEIETDDECLKYTSAEEDAEKNTFHYLNVIIAWQKIILTWELDWDVEAPDAPVQLAVISEVLAESAARLGQEIDPVSADLHARIKQAWDPHNILNPGKSLPRW